MVLSKGYSPIFLSTFNEKCEIYGHGIWKFNTSLINCRVSGANKSFSIEQ